MRSTVAESIAWIGILILVFLLVYYYKGTVQATGAFGSALTSTIGALQGQVPVGRSLPSQ